ncbi:3-isopropylmalate dehydratase large subunit [Bradyrhizobium sp. LHD-71]|uniref:3-isopropylmalate dehydratase large subunit n=1 Tax=Bradyrhizobium sp. LHD-71 TaxID=3072141 RepID=UPI00281012D7|nr:3-isopropylmalate dehydratase large subunit [Bradyrhizobium sp. LHD-71]MDQ8732007.1 3-isopropylmalate dehydratase large subunit [Bradyrhizobium sp. LHD-71]
MGMTLAEKIIAKAAGRPKVAPGEIVTCKVDLAMIHDSGGPRRVKPILDRLDVGVWDPSKVVLITDHYVPATDDESRNIQAIARSFAAAQRIANFYDQQGICHVVLPERGHLRPGMFAVGGDSHSPTGGAFGAYMFGVGATEMAGVLATGEIWLRVPETILIDWTGKLGAGVSSKDMMLLLCAKLGMDGGRYQAVQYAGDAVRALPMQERMTLANMAAELGGQAGLIEADSITKDFLRAAGADVEDDESWRGDADATMSEHHVFDATALEPQVAAPHSPANAAPVSSHTGTRVDVAYIGACTGAKLEDLRMAASVLRGRKAARGVELLVAPASLRDQEIARREGTLDVILQAGGRLLANACGICAGYGDERFGENVTAISSTARNFKGRMGAATSNVYLGSPYTVAASAVEGRIADPRAHI